jgi:DNA replication and repair protein RecF
MSVICHSERSEESLLVDAKIISLQSLALSNFRNYEYARVEVSPLPVVLTGENGAGKTNILEAVSLLTIGRGLRRAKLSEIDKLTHNPQPITWAISANLIGRLGEVKIGTGRDCESIENTDKRIVKIDEKLVKGQAELSRHTSMIWLTPQMEQLFGESASAGRKFLDRLVFSFDADHASRINEYDYAMRERNKLLALGRGDKIWLDALEQTMAETASATALARITTADHINHTIASSPLSFPKAFVEARGFVEDLLKAGSSALEAENALKTALAEGRGRDGAAGRTLVGTHRSELCVTHLGKNMPAQNCSMGEQKAMMLSIILAQARAGSQWHGVTPIILLDEVAGHLDSLKRSELFEEITEIKAQTWMTGTDFSQFADLQGKAQFFKVENGAIIPQ